MNRQVVGARIVGWSLVVLGAGHLATTALDSVRTPDAATVEAMAALRQASVAMPGPTHNLEQLMWGYSALMGLMVIAFGAAFLWAAGRTADSLKSLLWIGLVVTLVGLVVSLLLMPLPPIIGLSVALVGAILGLTGERTKPSTPGV